MYKWFAFLLVLVDYNYVCICFLFWIIVRVCEVIVVLEDRCVKMNIVLCGVEGFLSFDLFIDKMAIIWNIIVWNYSDSMKFIEIK